MRLFVALQIPQQTRSALAELTASLAPACRRARWSRPEGMHLTLKFIGEVASDQVKRIATALAGVRAPSTIEILFRGVGFFPSARHPRVFWAGVEAGPHLAELAAGIERVLEPLEIVRETREFRPHLTLARFKSENGLPALHSALERMQKESGAVFDFGGATFDEFHLIESKLRPQGAVYSTLETFPFTAANSAPADGTHL